MALALTQEKYVPRRLCSKVFPLGLPDKRAQQPFELQRVLDANVLYEVVAKCEQLLRKRRLPPSLENPTDILLWFVQPIGEFVEWDDKCFACFQHCACGGERPTWTSSLQFPRHMSTPAERRLVPSLLNWGQSIPDFLCVKQELCKRSLQSAWTQCGEPESTIVLLCALVPRRRALSVLGDTGATSFGQPATRGCLKFVTVFGNDDVHIGRDHRNSRGHFSASSKWCKPFRLKDSSSTAECVESLSASLPLQL